MAIIPAKLTSRRLVRKNLALLFERPLLSYTLAAARLTPSISKTIVSSESPVVHKLAVRYGAQSHHRSEALCQPDVTNQKVIEAVLEEERIAGEVPDYVVLLQPTHPLRRPRDLARAIDLFQLHDEADCLMTVAPVDLLLGEIDADGLLIPERDLRIPKRQRAQRYRNTGSFYLFRPSRTLDEGRLFGSKILPFIMEHPEFEVDIDYATDLERADALLRANLHHFNDLIEDIDSV
ncbi:acylneuraminate cytidylyltransferase family protein [Ahrensia marina]|uniref:acylneuraminate cytidylyltransferase family protein n=1 Tax=Ahrensia marina TaxID=1514904 RepID=UPI0035CF8093